MSVSGGIKRGSGQYEYFMCCPFCISRVGKQDTSYKLGFNTKLKVYSCFRCGARPSETGLYSTIFEDQELDSSEIPKTIQEMYEFLNSKKKGLKYREKIELDLISDPISQLHTPIAYSYMTNERGFSDQELLRYNIRVGHSYVKDNQKKFEWKGRILFPLFYESEPVYIVGRSYPLNYKPKYRNSAHDKRNLIYNLDNVGGDTVILCEGIVSAIAAERATGVVAVALLGKTILEGQIATLIRKGIRKVYLSLDGGVTEKDSAHLRKKLIKRGIDLWEVFLPKGEDPDDLGNDYLIYFKDAKKLNIFGEPIDV